MTVRSLLVSGCLVCSTFVGAEAQEIKFRPQGVPTAFYRGTAAEPKVDLILEASGVEPIGTDGKLVLVAHDKNEALFVVETATGRIVSDPISCESFPTGLKTGPKWEGMARDNAGNFYVIGSHSGKTEAEKLEKTHIIRFRLKDEGSHPTIDAKSVTHWKGSASLAAALALDVKDPLEQFKLKIEGLTVRQIAGKNELVVGLREPGDQVRVFAAELTDSSDSELSFRPLFKFSAGKLEGIQSMLTSMEYLPAWKGFLVVTATEDVGNIFHGNTLWFVPDSSIKDGKCEPVKVAEFEPAMKCEGLAELPGSTETEAKLVLTFDNDPHATKIPSRIQTVALKRKK